MAIPLLLFEIPYIKKNYRTNRIALIIGSLFPDIIDKPLSILSIASGRGYSHTILFILLAFIILHLITKSNSAISIPFLIGECFHLGLDLPYVPLFYPFIPYDFIFTEDPIAHWGNSLLTNPIIITTELVGAGIIIFIMVHNKLYNFTEIIEYLRTNSNEETNNKKPNNNIIKK
ncbi:MAG: metal-dependent hydrolase [Promethearchaeota archaeon]